MNQHPRPLARSTDLNVTSTGQETLIYDKRTDKAYVLSPAAAAVWRACNGKRTVQEIASYLSQDTSTDEQTVWYALGQMQDLLQAPVEVPHDLQGISRRQFLQRAGFIAVASIPVVVSIVAPPPAHAQSVAGFCCICNNGALFGANDCSLCDGRCSTHSGLNNCVLFDGSICDAG